MGVVMPFPYASWPVHAIMAPLSMANCVGTLENLAPCSSAMLFIIACSLLFAPTPPVNTTSLLSVCASALSVTSVSIEKATSCRLKQMSSSLCFLCRRSSVAAVSRPLNDKSMPFMLNGSGMKALPWFASFSTRIPKGISGFCLRPASRAKMSRQLPIAMSRVSPKTRYRPASKAATIVFPPETYSVTGSLAPVMSLPISTCAMLWLMPMSGRCRYEATARAAVAPVRRHGPSPGPWEKAMAARSSGCIFAVLRASVMILPATSAWCLAASLGCIPPSSGMYALIMLAWTLPFFDTMPTLKSSAVDSMPSMYDLFVVWFVVFLDGGNVLLLHTCICVEHVDFYSKCA